MARCECRAFVLTLRMGLGSDRVHEFEHSVPGKSAYSDSVTTSVELWDVSGDKKCASNPTTIAAANTCVAGFCSTSHIIRDVSVSHRYKDCWPAIQKDCDGVLFMFDADVELAPKSDVEVWCALSPPCEVGLSHRVRCC